MAWESSCPHSNLLGLWIFAGCSAKVYFVLTLTNGWVISYRTLRARRHHTQNSKFWCPLKDLLGNRFVLHRYRLKCQKVKNNTRMKCWILSYAMIAFIRHYGIGLPILEQDAKRVWLQILNGSTDTVEALWSTFLSCWTGARSMKGCQPLPPALMLGAIHPICKSLSPWLSFKKLWRNPDYSTS